MNIDVTAIINKKVQELEQNGTIEKTITDGVEKAIVEAFSDALCGWEFKRELEEEVAKSVSNVASQLGLSAYNGFVLNTAKKIIDDTLQQDLADKAQKTFEEILIARHDGIKLSEIIEKYREWLFANTDEYEKWERERFLCEVEERNDDNFFISVKVKLSEDEEEYGDDVQICFGITGIRQEKEKEQKENIYMLCFDGEDVSKLKSFSGLTDFEKLMLNLYHNQTPIILDFENVNTDNCYDIDC